MSSGKELITPPPPQLIQEGKWSYKAKVLQSRSPSDVTPMSLDTQFVEEDHIQMGNLVDGNAYVHVYKMKFAGELLDYIPFIVCGDQKLVYYLKYGGMPDKSPYYPQSTDEKGTKQLFPSLKPLISYENIYVPKRDLKNQALNEVYAEKGAPPKCLKFGAAESLKNINTKWSKGTLTCIDLTNTAAELVEAQLQSLSEISLLPGYYNPSAPKNERFFPHGVQRKYEGKVEIFHHYIDDEGADWLECFFDKIKLAYPGKSV